jgi:hypothetical protein
MHTNRRHFMRFLAASSFLTFLPPEVLWAKASHATRPLSKEKWMERALQDLANRGTPVGPLQLGRFKDPVYFLVRPITWRPARADSGLPTVTVPAGFVTDLTSIPRVFWSALRPDGDYVYAAILHDYLYWTQDQSREVADKILRAGMQDFGVSAPIVETIYEGVRLGGGSSWTRNAALKAAGERRTLRSFPTDPRITWRTWKKRADVFIGA